LEDFPSVYKKIKFMAYVLQIIKEKFAQVCKFFGTQLGGRGPTFLNPMSGVQRNKHICIKKTCHTLRICEVKY
jgi:hypothetical protein